MQKYLHDFVMGVGFSFLLDPTLNTSPEPHLQKVLPSRHPCLTLDLGLGTLCKPVLSEVLGAQKHNLSALECNRIHSIVVIDVTYEYSLFSL